MIAETQYSHIAKEFEQHILQQQTSICNALELADGKSKFITDTWYREDGGGGISRIIKNGLIFEKGGVNTSKVFGRLPATMQNAFNVPESNFLAIGLSLVLHPVNPYVPTVHANWR